MTSILVLHGPNLNLLGLRQPEIYGTQRLVDIDAQLFTQAAFMNIRLTAHQSNAEHVLIDLIQQAHQQHNFILFNPAAFTHTSIALRDALLAVAIPFIEIHLSDYQQREPFRHTSYFSDIAHCTIRGKGAAGYREALEIAYEFLRHQLSEDSHD